MSHRSRRAFLARGARLSGQWSERTWSIIDASPGATLVDVAGDGSITLRREPDGIDAEFAGGCDTDGHPYESSNPAENLDQSVDLWIFDRPEEAHRLPVTIKDGERGAVPEHRRDGN